MVEASIQLLSIEVQQPLLTETSEKDGDYTVNYHCEACHCPLTWTGGEADLVKELLTLDYKEQSLLSLYSKHRGFAYVLKEHIGTRKHCELVRCKR